LNSCMSIKKNKANEPFIFVINKLPKTNCGIKIIFLTDSFFVDIPKRFPRIFKKEVDVAQQCVTGHKLLETYQVFGIGRALCDFFI
ncbi:MAG: hypothetical protein ABR595_10255, partial [Psychroflexus sp.]